MEKSIEELIYEETEERLKKMSASNYQFPNQADIKDVVAICLSIGVCLLLIILCMVGVIV